MSKVARLARAEQWADRICTQMGKSVESIIEVGRLLIKAKEDLAHGEWERMFDGDLVPFGVSTARRLMAVAGHPILSNRAHVHALPPAWGSLYELTKVPEPTLKNAIKDGVITPDMPRKSVAALLPPKARKRPAVIAVNEKPVTWSAEQENNAIRELLKPVRTFIEAWPDGRSFRLLIHELNQLVKYVERLEKRSDVEISA